MNISVADTNYLASKAFTGGLSPSASGVAVGVRRGAIIESSSWTRLGDAAAITSSFICSNHGQIVENVIAAVSSRHLSFVDFFTDDLVVTAIASNTSAGVAVPPRPGVVVAISESEDLNKLAAQVVEALPVGIREPSVWADVGEIAFEWKWGTHHAILSLDEDGAIGYAMLQDEHFKPGSESFSLESFPKDLEEYLRQP